MNFYWVGGSGEWNDDTNHWATSSGGSPGAGNLPTLSDNVYIDSNSGLSGGTISDTEQVAVCKDFTSTTGVSYNFGGSMLNIYGSAQFENSIVLTNTPIFSFLGIGTIKTSGLTLYQFRISGTSYTLLSSLIATSQILIDNGTFDANDFNITADNFYFYGETGFFNPTIRMGNGVWEATGENSGGLYVEEIGLNNVTIIPENSTIKLNNIGGTLGVGFVGGGKTFNNLWISGSNAFVNIQSSNTFNDLKIDAGLTVKFEDLTTQTLTTFTATGTSGNLITLDSILGTGQFILSKTSGTVISNYLNLSNSNATGGAVWYAGANSVNTINNTGWIFTNLPTTTPSRLGKFVQWKIKSEIKNCIKCGVEIKSGDRNLTLCSKCAIIKPLSSKLVLHAPKIDYTRPQDLQKKIQKPQEKVKLANKYVKIKDEPIYKNYIFNKNL